MRELHNSELRDFLLRSTDTDILRYWTFLQKAKQANGEPHYTVAYDSATGAVLAKI